MELVVGLILCCHLFRDKNDYFFSLFRPVPTPAIGWLLWIFGTNKLCDFFPNSGLFGVCVELTEFSKLGAKKLNLNYSNFQEFLLIFSVKENQGFLCQLLDIFYHF